VKAASPTRSISSTRRRRARRRPSGRWTRSGRNSASARWRLASSSIIIDATGNERSNESAASSFDKHYQSVTIY